MPNISWTLQKTCSHCGTQVTYTSELGEKFKLSEAQALRERYTRAKAWLSEHKESLGDPRQIPLEYQELIILHEISWRNHKVTDGWEMVPEPPYFYVKCPVCNERIYVC